MGRWQEQIEALRKLDVRRSSFGAPSHRFHTRPITLNEVFVFEESCGIDLPKDYREYLLDVGFGAGPYHGLLTFRRISEELEQIYATYDEEYGGHQLPADDFGLESTIADALDRGLPLKFPAPVSSGGFIPVCEQGCEFLAVLVTTGKFRGRVFDTTDFAIYRSLWSAPKSPPGVVERGQSSAADDKMPPLPSFTEWAEAWIRCCSRDLKVP
jgi:hypothetical protein